MWTMDRLAIDHVAVAAGPSRNGFEVIFWSRRIFSRRWLRRVLHVTRSENFKQHHKKTFEPLTSIVKQTEEKGGRNT